MSDADDKKAPSLEDALASRAKSPASGISRRGADLVKSIEGSRGTPSPPSASPLPLAGEGPGVRASLVAAALAARSRAYAPYSKFFVGAAVQAADGRVFTGANVENASYGLSICAERSAIAAAAGAGVRELVAMAVATGASPPSSPCGMCRQFFAEFAVDDAPVALVNDAGEHAETTLGALLPRAFRGRELP